MKCEDMTTKEDKENRIIRIHVTAENWEENKMLAKGMGHKIDEPEYVECVVDLNKGVNIMSELQEGSIVHKAEMLEMDYLRSLGIEPNFADVSRHVEKLLAPALDTTDDDDEIAELEADNEELSYNCEALEDKLDSIEDYVRRMRKQLKENLKNQVG